MSLQQKFTKSEQTTQNCEEELAVLRTQLESSKQKHEDLTQKLSAMEVERDELSVQCRQRTDKIDDLCQQLAKQNDEMNQARERLKELMTDNDELQNRMRIIENTNFIADDDSSDSNKNLTSSGNKAAFLDLINNSKLKGSDDIINAIWNVSSLCLAFFFVFYSNLIKIHLNVFFRMTKMVPKRNSIWKNTPLNCRTNYWTSKKNISTTKRIAVSI